ncbi:MAG: hypothetical protein ACYCZX_16430, partial [Rhodospirillaceae bacterium]
MNKQQLYTAGSVLLATTALTGAANAGIVSNAITAGDKFGGSTVTSVNVANTIFSTTAATANALTVGPKTFTVTFSNNFGATTKFSMEIDPIGAAFFNQVDARLLLSNAGSFLAGGFYTVAASGNC